MSALISYLFLQRYEENRKNAIIHFIAIRFDNQNGVEFSLSLGKVTGLFWLFVGIATNYILKIEIGNFITAILFLAPVWIGAFMWERKNTR